MKKLNNILKFGFLSLNLINASTDPITLEFNVDQIINTFREGDKKEGIISSNLSNIKTELNKLSLSDQKKDIVINGTTFTVQLPSDIKNEEQLTIFQEKFNKALEIEITRTTQEPNQYFPNGVLNFKQYNKKDDNKLSYVLNKKKIGLLIVGIIGLLAALKFGITKLTENKNSVPSIEI